MSATGLADRAAAVLDALDRCYPDAHVELDFDGPFQLLVATILSAQSTDRRVNLVTPALFARYPDAAALAAADLEELQEEIRSTGFFRQKSKAIVGCAAALVRDHQGEVPATLEQLVALPGVGRKTANVVLAGAFGLPGIAVDTHCKRVGHRLGLTTNTDPVKVEHDLGAIVPRARWVDVSRLLIWHGRYRCKARKPQCDGCAVLDLCPFGQTLAD